MPPSPSEARRRADDVLRATQARADRIITLADRRGTAALRALVDDLSAADFALRRRLRRFATVDERFTAAQATVYQRQVSRVLEQARGALSRALGATTRPAATEGLAGTARLLERLEEAFVGVSRPLRLRQAATMSSALARVETSLLSVRATSVDRYGQAMIAEFERRIRVGLIRGATQREMVDELCGMRGPRGEVSLAARETPEGVERLRVEDIPEGLFRRYRSWAQRIVRTETARAYSTARMEGLFEQRADFPELRKKILATFDSRTAFDSVGVHGEVRRLEEPFVDGAGRVYLQPPARPNDREVVIPWLPEWEETPITRRLPPSVVEAARARDGSGIDPAARRARLAAARATSARQRAAANAGE